MWGTPIIGNTASTTVTATNGINPPLNRERVILMFPLTAENTLWPDAQYYKHHDVNNQHLSGSTEEIATKSLS